MPHPLHSLREYYLDFFRESLEEVRSRFDEFTTELLLELPSLKYPEYCHRLYRVDIIGKRAGESRIVEVNVVEKEPDAWQAALPSAARIDAPIVWNGLEFRITGTALPKRELVAWALHWLDVSDSRYDESAMFQQVVHSISPPTLIEGGYEVSVDFGSAPVSAFDELLELLVRDASRVSIGSFSVCQTKAT